MRYDDGVHRVLTVQRLAPPAAPLRWALLGWLALCLACLLPRPALADEGDEKVARLEEDAVRLYEQRQWPDAIKMYDAALKLIETQKTRSYRPADLHLHHVVAREPQPRPSGYRLHQRRSGAGRQR